VKVAYLMIRAEPQYRRDSFAQGLRAAGFTINAVPHITPNPQDVLVIWNRYGRFNHHADVFEHAGARVIVAENGFLGRDAPGGPWYSVTETNPLAAGTWPAGNGDRWEEVGAKICEWRTGGNEIIILAQRGIGPPKVRQPDGWHRRIAEQLRAAGHKVRIREHPGEKPPVTPLEVDLRNARAVVTWASGAAFKALLLGVPVFYGCATWVGREAAIPLDLINNRAMTTQWRERLPTFQRLAWSQWRTHEIATGLPFLRLLSRSSGSVSTPAAP
jgi:hypothetical protein